MKYFKLFEQFLGNSAKTNEAKSSHYTLAEYIKDDIDKDEKAAAEQIAKEMGLDPKDIAIVTSEDDNYGDVEMEIGSAEMKPIKTVNKEANYWHSKKLNVVKYQDPSIMGYIVPVEMLDKL